VALRIAFDLDGVLADMDRALRREREALIGEPAANSTMTIRQEHQLWRHVEAIDNFWESLDEIEPGAIARLASLVSEQHWEVIFLTRRPRSAGATAQVQTQRWLAAKGFTLPSVYVVQGNRGRIAAALDLDFVVDDRPENCLDVAVDSRARAILIWRVPDDKGLPPSIKRFGVAIVPSVEQCLNLLAQVDAKAPDKPRLIERVMQLLGAKDASTSESAGS
jgi:hypothetical protein